MRTSRWLRTAARFLPYRRGLFERHLRVMRGGMAVAGRIAALRGVEVVPVSATASVRVHRRSGLSATLPALLWIHGGGYVAGSASMNDRAVRRMAAHLGALAVSVEYRLAPEHPYPSALDDCYAALQWLAARDDVDRRRILVVGNQLVVVWPRRSLCAVWMQDSSTWQGRSSFTRCLTIERFSDRPRPQREAGRRKTIGSAGVPTWVANPARAT
jgi:alpha/beta hydrolase fold